MLQDLFSMVIDEKLRFSEFESSLLRKIEVLTTSSRLITGMMEAMLDNQDFIGLVMTIVKRVVMKAVDIEPSRKQGRHKIFEAVYSRDAYSASSSNRSSKDISDKQKIRA